MRHFFYWAWAGWFLYFGAFEGVAIYLDWKRHLGEDLTLTHFIATHLSVGIRVALLAWLVYHFIFVHKYT